MRPYVCVVIFKVIPIGGECVPILGAAERVVGELLPAQFTTIS